ncbi:hypothetical protein, partial [Streptococcus uberis]|uniref:hypothetical protein n=1 Tax=Streptococcus uberis TaxID=1349 RepID=UPI003D6AAC3D
SRHLFPSRTIRQASNQNALAFLGIYYRQFPSVTHQMASLKPFDARIPSSLSRHVFPSIPVRQASNGASLKPFKACTPINSHPSRHKRQLVTYLEK